MNDHEQQQVQGDAAYLASVMTNLQQHYLNGTVPEVDGEPLLKSNGGRLSVVLLYRLYRYATAEGYGS